MGEERPYGKVAGSTAKWPESGERLSQREKLERERLMRERRIERGEKL